TGNTLRCEVSFARSVVVMLQPLRIARTASAAIRILPRKIPCWSANDSRTVSSCCSSMSASALAAASYWPSSHSPWRSTKLIAADLSFEDDAEGLLARIHPDCALPGSPRLVHAFAANQPAARPGILQSRILVTCERAIRGAIHARIRGT